MYFFTNLPLAPAFRTSSPSAQALYREEHMTKRSKQERQRRVVLEYRLPAIMDPESIRFR